MTRPKTSVSDHPLEEPLLADLDQPLVVDALIIETRNLGWLPADISKRKFLGLGKDVYPEIKDRIVHFVDTALDEKLDVICCQEAWSITHSHQLITRMEAKDYTAVRENFGVRNGLITFIKKPAKILKSVFVPHSMAHRLVGEEEWFLAQKGYLFTQI